MQGAETALHVTGKHVFPWVGALGSDAAVGNCFSLFMGLDGLLRIDAHSQEAGNAFERIRGTWPG